MLASQLQKNLNIGAQPVSSLPDIPKKGGLVKVCYAGACTEGPLNRRCSVPTVPHDSGSEMAGILQSLSKDIPNANYNIGDQVIVFPDEKTSKAGLAEVIAVDDADNLIQVPKNISLEVASMLPGAALTAYSAVNKAKVAIEQKLKVKNTVNVLIVGAGGQGLWTIQVAQWLMSNIDSNRLHVTIADSNIDRLLCALEYSCYEVIHWNEEDHEQYIIERTQDACRGSGVDIVIDYIGTQRTVNRALSILNKEGMVMFGGAQLSEVSIDLQSIAEKQQCIVGIPKGTHSQLTELVKAVSTEKSIAEKQQCIVGIPKGTHSQLTELVKAVSTEKLKPPCYSVYNVDEAAQVFEDLKQSRIVGRAILCLDNPKNTKASSNKNNSYSNDNDSVSSSSMDVTDD